MSNKIQVLLADKHSLIRAGARVGINAEEDLIVVGEAINGNEAQQLSQELNPDVLLLGLNMNGPNLAEITNYLQNSSLKIKILVLAVAEKIYKYDLMAIGVAGYVSKSEEIGTIAHAIRVVARGHVWFSQALLEVKRDKLVQTKESTLTDQELKILKMIAKGWSNTRIAMELCLAKQTVRNYTSCIYNKLEVSSRAEAVIWTQGRNFVQE